MNVKEMHLVDMQPGERAVIKGFSGVGVEQLRLMEMGLLPGTEVNFIRRAPFGDPLEVELRGYHLSLRSAEAGSIVVESVEV